MNPEKKARLEANGWRVGTVQEFLGLSDNEMAVIEHAHKITAADVHRLTANRCSECGKRVHQETNICADCLREALGKGLPKGVEEEIDC